jgi:hypothetical protein
MATINNGEMGHTSETHAFVMGLTVEKVDDLTRKELSGFADADLELAGRAFGDGDIAIVLGKLDGEGFYNQIGWREGYCRRRRLSRRMPNVGHQRQQ